MLVRDIVTSKVRHLVVWGKGSSFSSPASELTCAKQGLTRRSIVIVRLRYNDIAIARVLVGYLAVYASETALALAESGTPKRDVFIIVGRQSTCEGRD